MGLEWWIASAVLVVAFAAERLHGRRVRAIASLLLGRSHRFTALARVAPVVRALALSAVAWAAVVLAVTPPQHWAGDLPADQATGAKDLKRLLILLDVSPSMDLPDAGGNGQTRGNRAAAVLDNLISRIDLEQTRISFVPFYTSARPVIVDAIDPGLVHYLATETTLTQAFGDGETDLHASVNTALELAKPWRNASTTLLVLTDGDSPSTTPLTDVPASINRALVIGVGDTLTGTFVDGHISRHDPENLRNIAVKLHGRYFDADRRFVPTEAIDAVSGVMARTVAPPAGRRDVALIVFAVGATALALLPAMLATFGTASRLKTSRVAPPRHALTGSVG